nr:MAG TPA: tail assembly chaperone protein [Caudoviricetes sp.]
MDKTLESFLHPHRKPNVKFRLPAFDEEFEMRALTAQEGINCAVFADQRGVPAGLSMMPNVAESLVTPNLRNKELQDALSEKTGKKVMEPYDAALALFTDSEMAVLISEYSKLTTTAVEYSKDIETAKNA